MTPSPNSIVSHSVSVECFVLRIFQSGQDQARAAPIPPTIGAPVPRSSEADDVAFDLLEECCPAYVRFSWWHERRFPVRDEIASLESAAFSGRVHVLHKPTMTNFWHFELEFRESEETILSNNSAKWKKKMYEFVCRDAVTGGGVVLDLDMPQCEPIPADLYT